MKEFVFQNYRHWVVIEAHKNGYHSSSPQRLLEWEGLRSEQFIRWGWYFRYRTALLQVEHPMWLIEMRFGRVETTKTEAEQEAQRLENKIKRAKAALTTVDNRLRDYKAQYRGLYPIEEDGVYQALCRARFERAGKLEELIRTR